MSALGVVISRNCWRWGALALTILLATVSLTACSGRNSFWNDGPKYGPRVISLGQSVPKGGGEYKLGKPYHDAAGHRYVPMEEPFYDRTGIASWYGEDFHGRRTANGEIYDMEALTAAHPTLPIPSYARVTSLKSGRTMVVRVNDRGPYANGRLIDLSWAVASLLQIESAGTGPVRVQYIGRAPLDGNDRHERQVLAQQPWAGARVAYAASPAKALRAGGGGRQYSNAVSATGGGESVREKFIRDRLTPAVEPEPEQLPSQQARAAPSGPVAKVALASADVVEGAAPRRAPRLAKTAAPTQPKPVVQAGLAPAIANAGATNSPVVPRRASPAVAAMSPAPAAAAASSAKPVAKAAALQKANAVSANTPASTPLQHPQAQNASVKAGTVEARPATAPTHRHAAIYIEAGVFRERVLADKLSTILAEIGPASVDLTSSGTEIVHRVKVGPFEKPDAADAAVARIRKAGLPGARILPASGI